MLLAMAALIVFGVLATRNIGQAADRYVVLISVDGLAATYLNDPRAPLPTLRKLMRIGSSAEGMITSFPSVTWPSHISLITGATPAKHGVIGNSVLDRATGKQITYIGDATFTKDECVRVPTLYDAVSNAGMKTASIIWPACNGAKTLNWMIPDSNQERLHRKYTTPGLAQELDRAGISISQLGRWGWGHAYSPMRDATYTRVAKYLLKKHQPNLLLLHLITPDHVEHAYGPHVDEAYWSVGNADDRIREIWETLQSPPLAGKSTLFIVSDHGFAPYSKLIKPNVVLRQQGLIEVDSKGKVAARRVWCHPSGGAAMIYIFDSPHRAQLMKRLKKSLAQIEGVAKVLGPSEFKRYGLPDPADNPQQADLMLSAKPGYSFSGGYSGIKTIQDVGSRKGAHGHLPEARYMHATFIAAGAGIKPGKKLKRISNLDVAPTIARLLGVKLPTADGRVLTEILQKEH